MGASLPHAARRRFTDFEQYLHDLSHATWKAEPASMGRSVTARAPGSVNVPVAEQAINNGAGIANGDVPDSLLAALISVLNAASMSLSLHHASLLAYHRAMQRKSFADMTCPIARSLEHVGEWWSMLILRDAFGGTTRFDDFQQSLGIAPNMLARRLAALVDAGPARAAPLQRAAAARRIRPHRARPRLQAGADRAGGVRQEALRGARARRAHALRRRLLAAADAAPRREGSARMSTLAAGLPVAGRRQRAGAPRRRRRRR